MKTTVIATFAPEADHVRARALVDAKLRVRHLEVRERPQPDRGAVDEDRVGGVCAEQRFGDRRGEDHDEDGRDRRRPRDRRRRRARDPRAARGVVVLEVEADERLADARAQEDAARGSPR